jgi:hypothetical protein
MVVEVYFARSQRDSREQAFGDSVNVAPVADNADSRL